MKKKNLFITLAVVIVAATVAFVSCKKEKQEQTSNNIEQGVQCSDNMDEYLISFKKKLLSAQKGDETISLEQAQRDLSNLLNFDFGDANYATNIFHDDTLSTRLSLTNDGQIDLSQLATTYLDLRNQVKNAYHLLDFPEKTVYSITCTFDNNIKDNGTQVTAILTTRAYDEITMGYDDWRAGNKAGKCDGTLVNFWGAPEEVTFRLRSHLGTWVCPTGRAYFTEEVWSWIESIDSGMYDSNSPCNHRLFYKHDPTGQLNLQNTCLPYSEIIYYYNQARVLDSICGSYFHPNPIPSDHVVTNYSIEYNEGSYSGSKTAWWKIRLKHAKLNCTDQPIVD